MISEVKIKSVYMDNELFYHEGDFKQERLYPVITNLFIRSVLYDQYDHLGRFVSHEDIYRIYSAQVDEELIQLVHYPKPVHLSVSEEMLDFFAYLYQNTDCTVEKVPIIFGLMFTHITTSDMTDLFRFENKFGTFTEIKIYPDNKIKENDNGERQES